MKNIIRFNDLTTMECTGFTPTLIDNVDALIIEFHYENFIKMNEHSVDIYRKFKDEFALKKLELVDEHFRLRHRIPAVTPKTILFLSSSKN